jgi:hypothetical protein
VFVWENVAALASVARPGAIAPAPRSLGRERAKARHNSHFPLPLTVKRGLLSVKLIRRSDAAAHENEIVRRALRALEKLEPFKADDEQAFRSRRLRQRLLPIDPSRWLGSAAAIAQSHSDSPPRLTPGLDVWPLDKTVRHGREGRQSRRGDCYKAPMDRRRCERCYPAREN